ncbi:hypothetical protein SAMN05421681_10253 [Lysobacter enzymogenes]|nr:hypothetical protein SAMN05421681_10253 [Lysobacter enzymogenes]
MALVRLASVFIALVVAAAPSRAGSLSERYRSVMLALSRQPELSTAEKTDRLNVEYALHFGPVARQQGISREDSQALFDAANMMASYTMYFRVEDNPRYIEDMIRARGLLQSAGGESESNDQNLYDALIAARRFDEARDLARTSSALRGRTVPTFDTAEGFDPARPGYFEYSGDKLMLRNASAPGDEVQILIVSGCHAARDAARGIAGDAGLREAFRRGGALWLTPADRTFDPVEVKRWNADFPNSPIRIAFNHSAWKDVDFTRQPTFFFFKADKLVGKSVGWSRSGPPQALLTALRESGLMH